MIVTLTRAEIDAEYLPLNAGSVQMWQALSEMAKHKSEAPSAYNVVSILRRADTADLEVTLELKEELRGPYACLY